MKIREDKYPMGSFPYQKSSGRYIDEDMYENLKLLAKVITNDMTFLGIISSSTLEVGTGKSVFAQQIMEAWVEIVNKIHNFNLPDIDINNIVFRPKDLITRAFKVPRYSCIIVDEWEDAHYWSELGMSLRQFFRKCRQLNLFIIIIIPNFFQLPMAYAISRSIFFIDVKFVGNFERGNFNFYSFAKKKKLYLDGKKTQNYNCVEPDFKGEFKDGYVIDKEIYKAVKLKDLDDVEKNNPLEPRQIIINIFKQLVERLPEITIKRLSYGFDISDRTATRWLHDERNFSESPKAQVGDMGTECINNLLKGGDDGEEKEEIQQETII